MIKTWTTKTGEEILISEMENSHLLNTIAMLERKAEIGAEVEVSRGYVGDEDFMTEESDFLQGQDYLDYVTEYAWLKEESKKRLLKNVL